MRGAPFTKRQYVQALTSLGSRVSEGQRRMLVAHASAPGRDLSVSDLAHAAGQRRPHYTYAQCGRLGHLISDALQDGEGFGVWTAAVADGYREPDSRIVRWVLYSEVADALEFLGWTLSTISSNPAHDIEVADSDLKAVSVTTRKALIEARVGQGVFRQALVSIWGGCAVTGCSRLEALRASHIKPWRDATNKERLDPRNGLLLLGTIDALFDAGLVAFAADRRMLLSSELTKTEISQLGISRACHLRELPEPSMKYLAWHRERVFRR